MGHPGLVIVSNRGPLSFTRGDDGELVSKRGAGGLVSTLGSVVAGSGATWVAGAISEADRDAASRGVVEADGFRVRSLVVDPDAYRQFYDVVANATLWFLHHDLFDLPRRPRIDGRWREAWATFRDVNRAFAEAAASEAPEGGTVLVQDYHLPLVGTTLADLRPDVRTAHFHHTPFCEPPALRVLPDDVAHELLAGLTRHGACGFHSHRWARAFEACCLATLGVAPRTYVSPAAAALDEMAGVAASEDCQRELEELEGQIGDRRFVARVDRIELSKNLLRGFLAFEELLLRRPEWRERVVFGAFVYPSRETLADYLSYRSEVEALVERVNNTWATSTWTPVLLDTSDSFPRSVAALRRYDVLLVNPLRDGLNLVAKEGVSVNERDGVLLLSREAGVWDELAGPSLEVNPFDVAGTADALHLALTMDGAERTRRAERARRAARGATSQGWLGDQLAAATTPR